MSSIKLLVVPAFSKDGKLLAVYIQGNAETVDAQCGTTVNSLSVEHQHLLQFPRKLTISRHEKVIKEQR